jgi:hypothetical protein
MFNTGWRGPASGRVPVMLAFTLVFVAGAEAKYGGGSGTADDPYQIWTPEQLNTIGVDPNDLLMNFKLMADIDLAAYREDSFHLIGFDDNVKRMVHSFRGIFDGNGHTISNLTYLIKGPDPRDRGTDMPQGYGLFRYLAGTVENLGIVNPMIRPAATCDYWISQVGALAGYCIRGTITNCYVQGGRISGDATVGGLVGYSGATMSQCHSTARVTYAAGRTIRPWPSPEVPLALGFGGLVGSHAGEIRDSYATGAVQGPWVAGGLAGVHQGGFAGYGFPGVICNCFATGSVSGSTEVGALVGSMRSNASVAASYASGRARGDDTVGGLVGLVVSGGTVADCYATGGASGQEYVGGLVGEILGRGSGIANCYAVGPVTGEFFVGGLVGHDLLSQGSPNEQHVVNSFWDTETTGQIGRVGGDGGKTTAEMQRLATYMAAGWDFGDASYDGTPAVWKACSGRPMYPKLAWQKVPAGDYVDPEGVDGRDLAWLADNWLQHAGFPCYSGDLTFDSHVNFRDFAVLAQGWRQGARKVICEVRLDSNPGWTTEGQWQFGPPGGSGGSEHGYPDPDGGSTGPYVYGVNLRGDYRLAVDGPHYLTAGPFDCRGHREVKLQFARWLNTDQAKYGSATVEVSSEGADWTTVWAYRDTGAELTENAWSTVVYDISGFADDRESVYIRWGYEVLDTEAWAFSGWNIDDIVLTGR